MSFNQVVVLLLELRNNERIHAVLAQKPLAGEWFSVLSALTYRAEGIRQQLAQAETGVLEGATALLAASEQAPAPTLSAAELERLYLQ